MLKTESTYRNHSKESLARIPNCQEHDKRDMRIHKSTQVKEPRISLPYQSQGYHYRTRTIDIHYRARSTDVMIYVSTPYEERNYAHYTTMSHLLFNKDLSKQRPFI